MSDVRRRGRAGRKLDLRGRMIWPWQKSRFVKEAVTASVREQIARETKAATSCEHEIRVHRATIAARWKLKQIGVRPPADLAFLVQRELWVAGLF